MPPGPIPLPGRGLADDEVELGWVSGIFGVRGEVRLHLHHRESDLFRAPREVVLVGRDGERRAAVLKTRPGAGKRVLGRIDGVDDRDAAAALKDWRLAIPRAEFPDLDDDEFYVVDVEGLPAFVGDAQVGVVVRVHPSAGVDIFEIDVAGESVFVPALADLVLAVDPDAGRVVLAEGALEAP